MITEAPLTPAEQTQRTREHRARRRDMGRQLLVDYGIPFNPLGNGSRLHVEVAGTSFDFWPGSGRWAERGNDGCVGYEGITFVRHLRTLDRSIPGVAIDPPEADVHITRRANVRLKPDSRRAA